jgi:trimeric autotransporter adhesin
MPRLTCAAIPVLLCALLTFAGCGGGRGSTGTTPPPTGSSNPVPTAASVTPSSATAGASATAITVTGSDFISSSAIQWNGAALATTFVSATSLQATIPASDLTNGIAAKLTVENPSPGGGTASGIAFTVNNPPQRANGRRRQPGDGAR